MSNEQLEGKLQWHWKLPPVPHSVVKSNNVKVKRKKMENQCHSHKQHNINLTWKFSFLSLSRPNILPRGIQTYKKVCDKKRQKEQKCTYNFTIRTHSTKCQQRGQQRCHWQCQPHISLWHTTTALRIQHPSYTEFTCWPSYRWEVWSSNFSQENISVRFCTTTLWKVTWHLSVLITL